MKYIKIGDSIMKLLSNYRKMAMVIISFMLLIVGFANESTAQKLQLVIGKYDCTTNGDCGSDQFCDIDTHRCIHYTDRAECPTSPGLEGEGGADCTDKIKPEECPTSGFCPLPEDCSDLISPEECPVKTINCALGQYNFNNKCVECVHNDNCPSDRPLCSDNKCVSCGAEHWNNYACVTCSGAKPKWDTSSLTCVECLNNDDCEHVCEQSTKTCRSCVSMNYDTPYYNSSTKACEICPKEKPIWYNRDKECKRCHDNTECEKFDISTPRCASDGKCYACESGTYWNTTLKNCVECLYEDHCSGKTATPHCLVSKGTCINCSGTTPIWNGSACSKCTSDAQCAALGTEAQMCDVSTGSCVKGVTITWNNMGTITTQRLIAGKSITASTPSWNGFPFAYWGEKAGSKASFPQAAQTDKTFYAFYNNITANRESWTVDMCPVHPGGYGAYDRTFTPTASRHGFNLNDVSSGKIKWAYNVYATCHGYNNDGCWDNLGTSLGTTYAWTVDAQKGTESARNADLPAGSTLRIVMNWDGWSSFNESHYWRVKVTATPVPQYPY